MSAGYETPVHPLPGACPIAPLPRPAPPKPRGSGISLLQVGEEWVASISADGQKWVECVARSRGLAWDRAMALLCSLEVAS